MRFVALFLATWTVARPASFIWDGGHAAQNFWSLNQNWNPNGSPVNDGTADLIFSGSIRLTPDANGAWSVNSITFDSFAGAFTLVGDTITLQGTAVTSAIANNSAYIATLTNALTLGGSQTWSANTADLSFTGAVTLGGSSLTLATTANISVSGAIAGTGALVKTGTGTLTLSGPNTYAGGTTVSGGTLQGTTTSLQGSITNHATVVFDQTTAGTYSGTISGTGSLIKQNTGTVTLGAANTFSGGTSVNAGTLILGAANALASTTTLTVASGGSVQLGAAAQTVGSLSGAGTVELGAHTLTTGGANTSTTFAGQITGTGGLIKAGTGTFTLTGANTYSGTTTIANGTLQVSTASLPGNVSNSGVLVFDQATSGTFAGAISGSGSVTKQDAGTLTITGPNTYTGSTTISGGTLLLGAANTLSDTTAVSIGPGATLQLGAAAETIGSFAGAGTINLGSFTLTAGGTDATTTFSGNITGTGGLVKSGFGTLTLNGTNTYSGGTVVSGGVLSGTTDSLQGSITNQASIVFDQSFNGTYAGAMAGDGALTKQGAGTVILTGTNAYTGGTAVAAGTLQGHTASLQGNITNNGAVIFDQSGTGTYGGVMSGTGSLTKQNTGTLTLGGANTYTGGTTVAAGILQGNTTSLQGNIVNQAAVVFDQPVDGTYAGLMSGAGSLSKLNSGTLTLSGANTYTGGTTVAGGVLHGTTVSLQGNITNDAAVVFDQATTGTYAGVMAGTGSLTKQNAGTLILGGANTYSGGTTVSGGTLQGTTSSLQGNITNDAAVVFDQSTSGTYAGNMSGSGALTKQNTGTVTLTGANSYSGLTTVTAGTLAIGANNATSATSSLALGPTATFALGGFSTQVGTLSYNTSIIDFGPGGTANHFLFSGGAASTGTLTINNYSATDGDVFAFATGATGVDAGFISGVYFYGIGAGVLGATGQAISGYGGTWDLIAPNMAAFTTWNGGGGNNSWTTAENWSGNVAPVSGPSLRLAFGGNTRLSPSLDASYTVNTLRFNVDAEGFTLGGTGGNTLTFAGAVPSIIQLSGYAQTIDVPVSLSTTTLVETSGAGDLIVAGELSGSGGLTKLAAGTLVLSGANTYTGETTVNAGTVVLRHGTALGGTTAGTRVSGGATLTLENNISVGAEALILQGTLVNAADTNSYAGAISGTGSVQVDGGSLTLGGTTANSYTGTTTVNSGTLALAKSAGVTALAGNLNIGNGTGGATAQLLASNQIADTAAVTLHAGGAPVLDVNGYTETIGSLSSSNAAAAVQLGSGSLVTGADNSSTTFAGVVSGTGGSLTKQGTGTFTLSGANTYTGDTTVSAGTLAVQHSTALGTTAGGTSVLAGATLQLQNSIAVGAEALALSGALVNAAGSNSYAGPISGTGTLAVNGGTLSLGGSDANTYSGVTTVNSGTLDLAKSGGANAVSGNLIIGNGTGSATTRLLASNQISDTSAVTLDAFGSPVLNLNNHAETIGSLASGNAAAAVQLGSGSLTTGGNNASTTFAGVISGAGGSLTKAGSGTLTLAGANTYTGGTTVSAGTLQGDATSLQGNITNNAAVVFDQSGAGTFAGAMSGSGTLTKQNAGTLVLTGANSYAGGTTVTAGTLQGNTTSLQGNITNNAAVVFDQSAGGTYAGAMSGSGSLTKQNSGTLVLTGANTYSGGTTVSGGALQGTATSLQGNITNNAAVIFDQATTGTYAGAMSGSGSLTKQNTGTLVLAGTNTYSGGTTVSAGTLQGNTSSLQGNITNSAAVVFDQGSGGTYSGVISGTGSLTKQNSGTLTLTGANTYSGATTVTGGRLALGLSNALTSTTSLTLGSDTTFSLNGAFSQQIGTLSFTNAGIDFGPTGTTNYFLLSNIGSTTGTLTIANWTSGADIFGVATNSVSQTFLDSVYFTGINVGVGAVISSTPTTIAGYGTFYTLTPIPTFTWSGGQTTGPASDVDNWSKSNNWFGGIPPAVGAVKSIVMAGSVRTTNDMDGAYQIKGLLFRSDAGPFTINSSTGDTLTIGGAGIMNESANAQTLNVAIAMSASQTWTADSGSLVINGASVLNNANTLTIDGAFNTTVNAIIGSGAGGLVKNGSGTLALNGANTFTGGVTINAGVVSIGADDRLGASSGGLTFGGGTLQTSAGLSSARTITLNAGGGTFDSNTFNSTLSGVISGAGGLTKTGAGTLTLSGTNTFSGGTTFNGGVLAIASDANLGNASGALTFGGGTLQTTAGITSARAITVHAGGGTFHSNGYDSTLSGAISGSGGLTKAGTGTLTLTGTNTYAGGTTVSAGTLQGSTTSLQGSITNNAAVVFDQSGTGTYAGVMSGTGTLTKLNSGTLTLTGANTYSGATTINAGTVVVQNASALGTTTGSTSVATGATLQLENNISIGAETLALAGTLRNASGANTYGGDISGAGGVTVDGGTLTLAGAATNTYTGATTVNAGMLDLAKTGGATAVSGNIAIGNGGTATVRLLGSNQISDTSAVTLAATGAPVLDVNGYTQSVGSLSSSNTASLVQLGTGGSLAVGGSNTSTTYAGVISGAGSFTKVGTGTFTVTGANTYTGGTTVVAGTLQGNTTSLQGNIANSGTVAFDQATAGTYSGVISGAGGLTKLNAGSLTLAGANTYTGATLISGGTLVLGMSGALSSTTALTISSGATLDVNSVTQTIGALAGAGNVALGAGTLLVGSSNASTTFGGQIAGTGVLDKIGSGTLTFNSSINFGGELKLTGGTVALAGINLTVGTLRISGNTLLDFGSSTASVLTATNVIIENGATLTITNWVDLQDFFYATGSLVGFNTSTLVVTPANPDVRGVAPQTQIIFTGFSNTSTVWQSYDSQITPTPEPATYGIMAVGAAIALVGFRRWRKRASAA